MLNNSWLKLAAVSLAGVVVSFGILWGINSFSNTNMNNMNNMNMGTGYQNSQTYGATENGYNMQGNMNNNMQGNMQGNMNSNMQGNMQGNMNGTMQGNMQGNMNGSMQGGMMMDKMQGNMNSNSQSGGMMDDGMIMGGMM